MIQKLLLHDITQWSLTATEAYISYVQIDRLQ